MKKNLDNLPCTCGHINKKHSESNGKSMERLTKQLDEGYIDNLKNRSKFWKRFLSEIKLDEFGCSICKCDSFKQNNLKYLEDLYDKKK